MLTRKLELKKIPDKRYRSESSENALICWAEGTSVTNSFYWSHQLAYEPLTKNKIPKNMIDEMFFGWYSRIDFEFSYICDIKDNEKNRHSSYRGDVQLQLP